MKATLNRFASLDIDSATEPQKETIDIDEDLQRTGPVTYSFETSQWSLDGTIFHLRQFKLQNITTDKRSTIFLRFAHEAQAKQVLHWITNEMKINATIKRVANSLADQKCYYCHRIGHWGSECQASLLSLFPSELITLISAELGAPDLFQFMLSSKAIFNAIANRQKTVVIARSHWRKYHRMKLKLGLLQYFKSVEKLVFRSLNCLATAIPMDLIASKYTQLTSLTINNCVLSDPRDHSEINHLDEAWVTAMTRMTRLQKLDLGCQDVSSSSYKRLNSVTHLTQLRVSTTFNTIEERVVPAGVKKLSMKSRRFSTLSVDSDQLQALYLHEVDFRPQVPLPSLERLIAPYSPSNTAFDAPNLTKLALYSTGRHVFGIIKPVLSTFSKLRSLLLDGIADSIDFSGLIELQKLTLSFCHVTMDLSPLINLKLLHLVEPQANSIKNIPEDLEVLRITYNRHGEGGPPCQLASLKVTRFELSVSREMKHGRIVKVLPRYLDELVQCSTLQELKVEYVDTLVLPYFTKFTQLKLLDLVQSSKATAYMTTRLAAHEDIIELSKQLPNTRIYHGYNLPTTIQRPKEGHWYDRKLEDSDLEEFECGCEFCKAMERGYFEEEFDSNRSTACFDPKPFKEHWAWY